MASHITLRHYRRYPRRSRTPRALRWFAAVVLLLLLLLPLFAGCGVGSGGRHLPYSQRPVSVPMRLKEYARDRIWKQNYKLSLK